MFAIFVLAGAVRRYFLGRLVVSIITQQKAWSLRWGKGALCSYRKPEPRRDWSIYLGYHPRTWRPPLFSKRDHPPGLRRTNSTPSPTLVSACVSWLPWCRQLLSQILTLCILHCRLHKEILGEICQRRQVSVSLHIQHCCHNWVVPFVVKLLPAALQAAIEEDVDFRRSLPIDYLQYMGVANYDFDTSQTVRTIVGKFRVPLCTQHCSHPSPLYCCHKPSNSCHL